MTPYHGGVSLADEDRNRGAGLPTSLTDAGYSRIVQGLERRRAKQAYWHGVAQGTPMHVQASAPAAPAPMTRTASTPNEPMRRFASVEAITRAGFTRIASGMYRSAHDIWELRRADDGDEYCLIRKREERAVDLRSTAGLGTQAAVASGVIARRAQLGGGQPRMPGPGPGGGVPGAPSPGAGPGAGPGGPGAMPVAADPMDDLDLGGGGDELVLEPGDEPPMPMGDDDFELDQAQEFFDAHEVAHGRDPVYSLDSPLVMGLEDLMNDDAGDDGNDNDPSFGDGGSDDDDNDDAGGDNGSGDDGGSDGGDSSDDSGGGNPFGRNGRRAQVADVHCGAADHGEEGHECARNASLRGLRILAVRRGGISEGTAIRMISPGDMEADFGEGPEGVPLEMILEPLIEALRSLGVDFPHADDEPKLGDDGDEFDCDSAIPHEEPDGDEMFGGDHEHDHDHHAGVIVVRAEDLL